MLSVVVPVDYSPEPLPWQSWVCLGALLILVASPFVLLGYLCFCDWLNETKEEG